MTGFEILLLVLCWYVIGVASYVHHERNHNDITLHRMLSEGLFVALLGPIVLVAGYIVHKPDESKILFKKTQDKPATIQVPLGFKNEGDAK